MGPLEEKLGFTPRRVLVLWARPAGELLSAVPALRALRAALPTAEVTLLSQPAARAFVQRFALYVDRHIDFPGHPGLGEPAPDVTTLPAFLQRMQEERFDLALQLHGGGQVENPLLALMAPRRMAGFHQRGAWRPDTELFLEHRDDEPEVQRLLALTWHLGIPDQGAHLEFPLLEQDRMDLASLVDADELGGGRYACVHVDALGTQGLWSAERLARVADVLAAHGLTVVITGSAEHQEHAEMVERCMAHPPVNLAGRTPLGPLAALISNARLVISSDAGISHLAAALRVPSVVLASDADGHGWSPADPMLQRRVCAEGGDAASTEMVIDQALALLGVHAVRAA